MDGEDADGACLGCGIGRSSGAGACLLGEGVGLLLAFPGMNAGVLGFTVGFLAMGGFTAGLSTDVVVEVS